MGHRKRSMMQHKVELSTLLRIVMERKKSVQFRKNVSSRDLVKALAFEAIEALRTCDHRDVDVKPGILHLCIPKKGNY
jgi:hypothetical protein